MSAPVVSVVMPVRNAERHVERALESVLAQTFGDLELVVVDDGSDDASAAILTAFAARDSRVRVVAGEQRGLTAALRMGCAEARGRYVARMDADDVALPRRLQLQVAALEADPALAAVGGAVRLIDDSGRELALVRYPEDDAAIRRRLERSNAFAHPAVTMRRDALESVGGYRLVNGEDYDLWLRLAERSRLANLREPVLLYRQHATQYSVARIDDQTVGVLAAQYAARLRRAGRPDPIGDDGALPPATLEALGLDSQQIAEAQAAHRIRWAAVLEQLGDRSAARELLDGVRALATDATAFDVRAAVARAQAALALGRPLHAARALAAAAVAHPLAFPREVARAVRSRGSFEPS